MTNDYRNTKYCLDLSEIKERKDNVVKQILSDHPKAEDMHYYISPNKSIYKSQFLKAYNHKCAYCGISIDLISKSDFEIDHYIYQKSPEFDKSKKKAGFIENLVLSCHTCNQAKSGFLIPAQMRDVLHPDYDTITKVFYRDELYNIKICPKYSTDRVVCNFYNTLKFYNDIHRLDYLLMSMIGLYNKLKEDCSIYKQIGNAIILLLKKRNIMS